VGVGEAAERNNVFGAESVAGADDVVWNEEELNEIREERDEIYVEGDNALVRGRITDSGGVGPEALLEFVENGDVDVVRCD
jgi:hypothetical protein